MTALAAAFPDLDYLGFWLDPSRFLSDWHRGLSHSLLMVPLWAFIVGSALALLLHRSACWREFVGLSALGLLSHIAADLFTLYGTQVLAPLSAYREAFSVTFDADPWAALIVGAGFALSALAGPGGDPGMRDRMEPIRAGAGGRCGASRCGAPGAPSGGAARARLALGLLAVYLGGRALLQQEALAVAYQPPGPCDYPKRHALPQPLSPFFWKLVVVCGERYRVAYLDLLGDTLQSGPGRVGALSQFASQYRPAAHLVWTPYYRFGVDAADRNLVLDAWRDESLEPFRRFARMPYLLRIDRAGSETCVWFTDLRYVLPRMTPPFRYGLCRSDGTVPWRLYRLRRFTENTRQLLGAGAAQINPASALLNADATPSGSFFGERFELRFL